MRGKTYVYAQHDRRSTVFEHRFVALYESREATMQGVLQGYPYFIGFRHIKVDTWLEFDLLNVATSITGVGPVSLLRHHGASLVLVEWDGKLWFRRLLMVETVKTNEGRMKDKLRTVTVLSISHGDESGDTGDNGIENDGKPIS